MTGSNGLVDVRHDRGSLLVETTAGLVQFVDLGLDRRRLVLEVVAQGLAQRCELGRQLGLHHRRKPGELGLDGRQRLVLMVRELGESLFQCGLQGSLVAIVGLLVRLDPGGQRLELLSELGAHLEAMLPRRLDASPRPVATSSPRTA